MIIGDYLNSKEIIGEIPALHMYSERQETYLKTCKEPEPGYFIAESAKVIKRAITAGYRPESFLVDELEYKAEAKALIEEYSEVPTYIVSHETYKSMTGFEVTRGLLALCRRLPLEDYKSILQKVSRIAVLENVVNPTNLGAIFRSAAALNMEGVLLTAGCTDPLYRRAARVSMGTVFQIPWTIFSKGDSKNSAYVELLKEAGFTTVAMALTKDTISIEDTVLAKKEKLAIILGTEGDGLETQTIEAVDYTVKIPMSNGVDSLNVAAASAVAFWELGKK